MSALCNGYEIVCPDGHVRHFPYHNEDDALFDAKLCNERCGPLDRLGAPGRRTVRALRAHSECPGGDHHARPIAFVHRKHMEKSRA